MILEHETRLIEALEGIEESLENIYDSLERLELTVGKEIEDISRSLYSTQLSLISKQSQG